MLQHVNTVLIGKNAPASYTNVDALVDGDIALFNESKVLVKTVAEAEAAKALYIGVCEGTEDVYDLDGTKHTKSIVRYSMPILKGSKPTLVFSPFLAKSEDKVVIDFTNVTVEIGHRYVLRMLYHDVYESPNQFPHVYEHICKTTNTADLVNAIAKKVNKHKGARIVASVTDKILTLTAKDKGDSEGLNPVNLYSQVSMDAFMYKTIPSGLLSNAQNAIENLTIAKTQGTPGKGNAKIVRDRENEALGYRGIQYRENAIYPYVAPELRVDLNAEYDTITMEWDNPYLSNDNQYIKTTPLAIELYVNKDELASSVFMNALTAYAAKA